MRMMSPGTKVKNLHKRRIKVHSACVRVRVCACAHVCVFLFACERKLQIIHHKFTQHSFPFALFFVNLHHVWQPLLDQ